MVLGTLGQERMMEWLDEYRKVCRRQERALEEMQDLRRCLLRRDEHRDSVSVSRLCALNHRLARTTFTEAATGRRPLPPSCPPEPFPARTCVVHHRDPRFFLAPNATPRRLQPLHIFPTQSQGENPGRLKGRKNKRASRKAPQQPSPPSPPPPPPVKELTRTKTDYEPLEDIAKRNKINLSYCLRYTGNYETGDHKSRKALVVTTVKLQDEELMPETSRSAPGGMLSHV